MKAVGLVASSLRQHNTHRKTFSDRLDSLFILLVALMCVFGNQGQHDASVEHIKPMHEKFHYMNSRNSALINQIYHNSWATVSTIIGFRED